MNSGMAWPGIGRCGNQMTRWRFLRRAAKENVVKASKDREVGSGTAVIDISAEPVNVLVNGALSAAEATAGIPATSAIHIISEAVILMSVFSLV